MMIIVLFIFLYFLGIGITMGVLKGLTDLDHPDLGLCALCFPITMIAYPAYLLSKYSAEKILEAKEKRTEHKRKVRIELEQAQREVEYALEREDELRFTTPLEKNPS